MEFWDFCLKVVLCINMSSVGLGLCIGIDLERE